MKVTRKQRKQVQAILHDWILQDGFQEGADGASEIAAVIFGWKRVNSWIKRFKDELAVRTEERRSAYLAENLQTAAIGPIPKGEAWVALGFKGPNDREPPLDTLYERTPIQDADQPIALTVRDAPTNAWVVGRQEHPYFFELIKYRVAPGSIVTVPPISNIILTTQ